MRKKFLGILFGTTATLCVLGAVGCTPTTPDQGVDDYDESYVTLMPAKSDDFVNIDGVLDDDIWAGNAYFTNYLSEDSDGTKAHVELTTSMTEKGLYIGAVAVDSNIVYNGLIDRNKNSMFHILIASPEATLSSEGKEIYIDAGRICSYTNSQVYNCEYFIKVDGEIGSGETQKMTAEVFIPWEALDMETPENVDEASIRIFPRYHAILPRQTTKRILRPNPDYGTKVENYYYFNKDGYMDADEEGAAAGNAYNGTVKTGRWNVDDFALDTENSTAFVSKYVGTLQTGEGFINGIYLRNSYVENFAFEATVVPLSYDDPTGLAYAGLLAELSGGKGQHLQLGFGDSGNYLQTNANGVKNFKTIDVRTSYNDYYSSTSSTTNVYTGANPNFDGEVGVKLKLIKHGTEYYAYVNDSLVWAGTESRARGSVYLGFYSFRCTVEYKDVSWTNFDGNDEALAAALQAAGTCRLETEVEGAGEATLDTLAVNGGSSATLTLAPSEGSILKDVLVNNVSILDDFKANAVVNTANTQYVVTNITENTTVKVVFEEYVGRTMSGKITLGNESNPKDISLTEIYAYHENKTVLYFGSAVNGDGTYSLTLPEGNYEKLYFKHSRYEKLFYTFADGGALTVSGSALTDKDFALDVEAFASFDIAGHVGTKGEWSMVDNGVYTVVAPDGPNDYSAAYFPVSLPAGVYDVGDFVAKATVSTQTSVQVGFMLRGTYNGNADYRLFVDFYSKGNGNYRVSLFGWHGTAQPVNWIGQYDGKGLDVDVSDIELTLARKDASLALYVNGALMKVYGGAVSVNSSQAFDISRYEIQKVGLGFRGDLGSATYSEYSLLRSSTAAEELIMANVNVPSLAADDGTITVTGVENGKGVFGSTVTMTIDPADGKFVFVKANGASVETAQAENGEWIYTYQLGTEDVTFVFETVAVQTISGTLPTDATLAKVQAIDMATGAVYTFDYATTASGYEVAVPDGTYVLYFDLGDKESAQGGVVVNGASVTLNVTETYDKFASQRIGEAQYAWTPAGERAYKLTVTANGSGNNYFYTNFKNSDSNDFRVTVKVKSDDYTTENKESAQFGVMMTGTYDGKSDYKLMVDFMNRGNYAVSLFGWHGTAQPVNWISATRGEFKGNATVYPTSNTFALEIIRRNDAIYLLVNEVLVGTWSGVTGGFDVSKFNVASVGLATRGNYDATFSDYTYTKDTETIDNALARTVQTPTMDATNGTLVIEGVTEGKAVLGSVVTVKVTPTGNKLLTLTANGSIVNASLDGDTYVYKYVVKDDVSFALTVKETYAVSGTVAGELSGDIYATDTATGAEYTFAGGLVDGAYSIRIPDGTYNIRFVGESVEGMLEAVVVNGADLSAQDLETTYTRMIIPTGSFVGSNNYNNAGDWSMTGNGEYTVSANVNDGGAWSGAHLANTEAGTGDFVITSNVTIENVHTQFGVALYGVYESKNIPLLIIFRANSSGGYFAGLYDDWYSAGWNMGWIGTNTDTSSNDGLPFTKTDKEFVLQVVRQQDSIKLYVNGMLMKEWAGSLATSGTSLRTTFNAKDYNVTKVGLFTRGTVGAATFSKYVYSTESGDVSQAEGYSVSGTVAGEVNGTVTATNAATGASVSGTVTNGAYSLSDLQAGTWKLYFASGDKEGLLTVTVTNADLTEQNLSVLHTKMVIPTGSFVGSNNYGLAGDWSMTGNGEYTVSANTTYDYIWSGAHLANTEAGTGTFAIASTVKLANAGTQVGVALYGAYDGKNIPLLVLFTPKANGGYFVGLYDDWYSAGWNMGWIGDNTDTSSNEGLSFEAGAKEFTLTVVRNADNVKLYINGALLKTWSGDLAVGNGSSAKSTFNFGSYDITKVGLLTRGRGGAVTFSKYSYSTDVSAY